VWFYYVRSNFLGTHFTTYDSGESPSHQGFTTDINNVRRELVAVSFVRLMSIVSHLSCSVVLFADNACTDDVETLGHWLLLVKQMPNISRGSHADQGLTRSLAVKQVYCWVWWWCKNFEDLSAFGEVMGIELRKVLFLVPSVCAFCSCMKYLRNRWTDLHQIHMKTCLVLRSDEFEGQDQRSRSPGTKNGILGPFNSLYAVCLIKLL